MPVNRRSKFDETSSLESPFYVTWFIQKWSFANIKGQIQEDKAGPVEYDFLTWIYLSTQLVQKRRINFWKCPNGIWNVTLRVDGQKATAEPTDLLTTRKPTMLLRTEQNNKVAQKHIATNNKGTRTHDLSNVYSFLRPLDLFQKRFLFLI